MTDERSAASLAVSPVRKGRRIGWRKPAVQPRIHSAESAYSIARWCHEADLSRTALYALWKLGIGPHHARIGGRNLINESPREFVERARESSSRPRIDRESSTGCAA
jgi:hypothetical protein